MGQKNSPYADGHGAFLAIYLQDSQKVLGVIFYGVHRLDLDDCACIHRPLCEIFQFILIGGRHSDAWPNVPTPLPQEFPSGCARWGKTLNYLSHITQQIGYSFIPGKSENYLTSCK
jgi:hypothetical protein